MKGLFDIPLHARACLMPVFFSLFFLADSTFSKLTKLTRLISLALFPFIYVFSGIVEISVVSALYVI